MNFEDFSVEDSFSEENNAYELLKDEIDNFRPAKAFIKDNFYVKQNIIENKKKDRMEILKLEYEKKMNRINKIKSRKFRKQRRAVKEDFILEESSYEEVKPNFNFKTKEFELENNDFTEEFIKEKKEQEIIDAPACNKKVLQGWGSWGGPNIIVKENKQNTVYNYKEGILIKNRKDYKKNNVIINENIEINSKYKSKLPYGHTKNQYIKKLTNTISKENTPARIFNKYVKSDSTYKGVEPAYYDPE